MADIGWARQHLTGGQSVRRRSWPYDMRLEMSKGVIFEFGALGVNVGRWSPLQADFLATDWEPCTRCLSARWKWPSTGVDPDKG